MTGANGYIGDHGTGGAARNTDPDRVDGLEERRRYERAPDREPTPGQAPVSSVGIKPEPEPESEPGPGGSEPQSESEIAERQRDEYLDDLRRLQADFENYKKRIVKQQTEHLERAAESLVMKLLPVIDALDLAVAHGAGPKAMSQPRGVGQRGTARSSGTPQVALGARADKSADASAGKSADEPGDEARALVQVAAMLDDVLRREGLERIDPLGMPFDPKSHDAVMHEDAGDDAALEVPEVIEVLRPGFRWKGRVLRPAMVKVKG